MTKQERFVILMVMEVTVFTIIPMLFIQLSVRYSGNFLDRETQITIIAKGGNVIRVFIEAYGDKAFVIIFTIVSVKLLAYSIEKIYPVIFNRHFSSRRK